MSTNLGDNPVKLKENDMEITIAVYDRHNAGKRAAGWVDKLTGGAMAICMLFGVMGLWLASKYFNFHTTFQVITLVEGLSNMNLFKW